MKKLLVSTVSLALIIGAIAAPAEAKKAPKPVVENGSYQSPPLVVLAQCNQSDGIGCVTFTPPSSKLIYANIVVTDATGLPVAAAVRQPDQPPVGNVQPESDRGTFCGKTDQPIAIDPQYAVDVWVGERDPSCPGAATSGTVKVTFTATPVASK